MTEASKDNLLASLAGAVPIDRQEQSLGISGRIASHKTNRLLP